MRDGPEAGLTHIDALLEHGELANSSALERSDPAVLSKTDPGNL